jgi:hypothetical protein
MIRFNTLDAYLIFTRFYFSESIGVQPISGKSCLHLAPPKLIIPVHILTSGRRMHICIDEERCILDGKFAFEICQ